MGFDFASLGAVPIYLLVYVLSVSAAKPGSTSNFLEPSTLLGGFAFQTEREAGGNLNSNFS
jgi:hypothetical protein